tara:strand:+ start:583 stop:747 length:165 start_codon:yes stop_codon:yes gene_type:complete
MNALTNKSNVSREELAQLMLHLNSKDFVFELGSKKKCCKKYKKKGKYCKSCPVV